MKVEDEVQLADIPEVFVQNLHERLHQFQDNQLVFVLVHHRYEVETRVSFVNYFVLLVIYEVAHLWTTGYH